MRILDLNQFQRFREGRFIKVLRHRDTKRDLWDLCRSNKFKNYQNGQSRDVFGKANYVVSFIAERHKYAKFAGVWEVLSKKKKPRGKGFRYRTKELPGFEDLRERLIVNWGDGTRSWAQWLNSEGNKEVVEILPINYVSDFPGFYSIRLPYKDLAMLIKNPDSHRESQRMLSSVSGIYIILDTKSGKQYIGSAYGRGGIWARWKTYVQSPSGGNNQLKKLLKNKPKRHQSFQFSILRVLEPYATKDEVLEQEKLTKHKLGSRAFGLNDN